MRRPSILITGCLAMGLVGCAPHALWRHDFNVIKATLSPTGNGRYWVLEPGRTASYNAKDGATLTIRVLDETKVIDGVTTRIVEEREEKRGSPIEITRNYLAIDPATGDIYYLGEDSTTYKDGKPAGDGGSWLAGVNTAKMGLLVPGAPKVGDRFHQEIAPPVAMDLGEVAGLNDTVRVPAGTFTHCLHVIETSPLDHDTTHKWYAPGIGLIKDDDFELVSLPAK